MNVISLSVLYYVLYLPFLSLGLPSIIPFVKCSCTCLQSVILPFPSRVAAVLIIQQLTDD
jgi:hypothetical protein